jgi:hypothetical protein
MYNSTYSQFFFWQCNVNVKCNVHTLYLLHNLHAPQQNKETKAGNNLAPLLEGFKKYLCVIFSEI